MSSDTVVKEKRAFLRKGTGLKRYFKDLDLNAHFHQSNPSNGSVEAEDCITAFKPVNLPTTVPVPHQPQPVLKSADSPKRYLNVRFAEEAELPGYPRIRRSLNFDDEIKENRRPIENEDPASDGEEWETDDSDEDQEQDELNSTKAESLVEFEITESAIAEIFGTANPGGKYLSRLDTVDEVTRTGQRPNYNYSYSEISVDEDYPGMNQHTSLLDQLLKRHGLQTPESGNSHSETLDIRYGAPPLSLENRKIQPFRPISVPSQTSTNPRREDYSLSPNIPVSKNSTASTVEWNMAMPAPNNACIEDENHTLSSQKFVLHTRILELESAIAKHKRSNREIGLIRSRLEKESSELEQSKAEFEIQRQKELGILDELRQRLKDDRLKIGRVIKEKGAEKKEMEDAGIEANSLRAKVAELEKEIKVRTGRWASTARNYKSTIESLRAENTKLQIELSQLKSSRRIAYVRKLRGGGGNLNPPDPQRISCPSSAPNVTPATISVPATILSSSSATPPITSFTASEPISSYTSQTNNIVNNFKSAIAESAPVRAQSQSHEDATSAQTPASACGEDEQETVRRASDGTLQFISSQGQCLEIRYGNGDIKDLRDYYRKGLTKYYYKESDIWEISRSDGTQFLQFRNGDMQIRKPNGIQEIKYANGVIRRLYPDGREECGVPNKK